MEIIEIGISILALFGGGCAGNILVEKYKIRTNAYYDFLNAYIKISRCMGSNEEREKSFLDYRYQEQIVRVYASEILISMLDKLRLDNNMEQDRPITYTALLSGPWKLKSISDHNRDTDNYFSKNNYNNLFKTINDDVRSIEFILNMI